MKTVPSKLGAELLKLLQVSVGGKEAAAAAANRPDVLDPGLGSGSCTPDGGLSQPHHPCPGSGVRVSVVLSGAKLQTGGSRESWRCSEASELRRNA